MMHQALSPGGGGRGSRLATATDTPMCLTIQAPGSQKDIHLIGLTIPAIGTQKDIHLIGLTIRATGSQKDIHLIGFTIQATGTQ